tara:strand:+ start:2641 stop:2853 length:213 start_codon:yes stop_codon:yes gene_type:complete
MSGKYEVKDILKAVDQLLDNIKEKPLELTESINEMPLELTNEVKKFTTEPGDIPKDTEKIILQAEKYLKK